MEVKHSDKVIDASSLGAYVGQPVWDDENKKWRIVSKVFDHIFKYISTNRTKHETKRTVYFSDGKKMPVWKKDGAWEKIPLYPVLGCEYKLSHKGEDVCQ